jgi:hypothetical protein
MIAEPGIASVFGWCFWLVFLTCASLISYYSDYDSLRMRDQACNSKLTKTKNLYFPLILHDTPQ